MSAFTRLVILLTAVLGASFEKSLAQTGRGPSGPFTVVVASVPRLAAAEALLAKVPNATEALVIKASTRLGLRYRVCIGRFLERPAAERQRLAVVSLFPEAWLLALGDTVLSIEPSKAQPAAAPAVGSLDGFLAAYKELLPALEQMDARRAQPFIHSELGLWVRHQPGTFAVVQRCTSLNEVLGLTALESATARSALEACWGEYSAHKPTPAERIPQPCVTTVTSDITDTLLVARLSPGDATLSAAYSAMKAKLVGPQLSTDEARMLSQVESLQHYVVSHRTAKPVRALYFALVEGRWVLTQLDLICDTL